MRQTGRRRPPLWIGTAVAVAAGILQIALTGFPRWTDAALVRAIQNNEGARVLELLRRGANPNAEWCSRYGSPLPALDWLIRQPDIVCAEKAPLLVAAAGMKSPEASQIVAELLRHGADMRRPSTLYQPVSDRPTTARVSAVLAAIEARNSAVISLLLQHQPNGLTSDEKSHLLDPTFICQHDHELFYGNADILRILLDNGVVAGNKPTLTDMLHEAVSFGTPEPVVLLLKDGADINGRDCINDTPLMSAALEDKEEIVQVLLTHGADKYARTEEGDTALHIAARNGQLSIVRLLATRGADARKRNWSGETPSQSALTVLNSGNPTDLFTWFKLYSTVNFLRDMEAQP